MLDRRDAELRAQIDQLTSAIEPLRIELANVARARAALDETAAGTEQRVVPPAVEAHASPYASFTIKELVLKALREHFPASGATAKQLLMIFDVVYGRSIERSSLSPQLSRLQDEGKIVRSRKFWSLPGIETPPGDQLEGVSDSERG